jgi:Flp pilus assembly pilin Flp
MRLWNWIWRDDEGTTSVEYCVMLGFIMLVVIGSVASFGSGQSGTWVGIWTKMRSAGI